MINGPKPEDYNLLAIGPDADTEETQRAYQRMKALYSEGSLATYSLMNEDERKEILDRIEMAYLRISRAISRCATGPQGTAQEADRSIPPVNYDGDTGQEAIGPFLKRCREDLGMTLKELSKRTRIRSTYLESIEEERFEHLPAPVYLRGFIIEFARAVDIRNPEELAARYLSILEGYKQDK
jgi:flagellar biosynthesis protein FlhG